MAAIATSVMHCCRFGVPAPHAELRSIACWVIHVGCRHPLRLARNRQSTMGSLHRPVSLGTGQGCSTSPAARRRPRLPGCGRPRPARRGLCRCQAHAGSPAPPRQSPAFPAACSGYTYSCTYRSTAPHSLGGYQAPGARAVEPHAPSRSQGRRLCGPGARRRCCRPARRHRLSATHTAGPEPLVSGAAGGGPGKLELNTSWQVARPQLSAV